MNIFKINHISGYSLFFFTSFVFISSNLNSLLVLYNVDITFYGFTLLLKFIREFFLFFLAGYYWLRATAPSDKFINLAFLLITILISFKSGFYNIIFGIHFLLPLLIFITPFKRLGLDLSSLKVNNLLLILLTIHLSLQFFHLIFGSGYFAFFLNSILNARNPGILFFPAASAFFTLSLFSLCYSINKKIVHLPLFCLSIFLCSSIMGLITFLASLVILMKDLSKRQKIYLLFYFTGSFVALHLARYSMTGNNYLKETGGGRANISQQAISSLNLSLSNENFGKATNGAANYVNGLIMDSLYPALMINLGGFLLLILLLLFVYFLHKQHYLLNDRGSILIISIMFFSSFGLIITENSFSFFILLLSKIFIIENSNLACSS